MKLSEADLVQIACDVIDHLNGIVPLGWRTASIRRSPSDMGLSVSHISTQGTPKGAKRAALGFDQGLRSNFLGDSLREIQSGLKVQGIVWDGLNASLSRSDEHDGIDLSLDTPQSVSVANIRVTDPDADLIITPALAEAVASGVEYRAASEVELRMRLGTVRRWRFFPETPEIELVGDDDRRLKTKVQVIGSYQREERNWLWSWANSSVQPHHHAGMRALRDAAERDGGLNVFRFPVFACELNFATAIAWLAADRVGCTPVFAANVESPPVRLYFGLEGFTTEE